MFSFYTVLVHTHTFYGRPYVMRKRRAARAQARAARAGGRSSAAAAAVAATAASSSAAASALAAVAVRRALARWQCGARWRCGGGGGSSGGVGGGEVGGSGSEPRRRYLRSRSAGVRPGPVHERRARPAAGAMIVSARTRAQSSPSEVKGPVAFCEKVGRGRRAGAQAHRNGLEE